MYELQEGFFLNPTHLIGIQEEKDVYRYIMTDNREFLVPPLAHEKFIKIFSVKVLK